MKHFFSHFFLPHHTNNHRAKVLHHTSLLIIITLLVFLSGIVRGVSMNNPKILGQTVNISTRALLDDTNLARASVGMPPLTANSLLATAAQNKVAYMFAHNFWAHNAPDGKQPWDFMKEQGYVYVYAGENLARGYSDAKEVTTAWMNSPDHRENLLSPNYQEVGFAVAQGDLTGERNTTVVVQMFGNRTETIATPKPGSPADLNPAVLSKVQVPNQVVQSKPMIDSSVMKTIGMVLVGCFILILLIDMLIIERRHIERLFSHNVDHLLYLVFIFGMLLLVGRGGIY